MVSHLSVLDIYAMSASLGAIIEQQVVETLNRLRGVWDPDDQYQEYHFVRQPQTYPDVVLRRRGPGLGDAKLGIELKGWYLLNKEAMPNLRFRVTPSAINPQDLVCCVP